MSCQPSLEPVKEFIQLVNHLLRWSVVLICGLEARRVVCRCRRRRRSVFFFSFSRQLLLPARPSVTPQLSANKSSDLLPAFSHPLSRARLSFLAPFVLALPLSLSIFMSSSSTHLFLLSLSLSRSRGLKPARPPAHATTAALLTRRRTTHFIRDPKIGDNRRLPGTGRRFIFQGGHTCV